MDWQKSLAQGRTTNTSSGCRDNFVFLLSGVLWGRRVELQVMRAQDESCTLAAGRDRDEANLRGIGCWLSARGVLSLAAALALSNRSRNSVHGQRRIWGDSGGFGEQWGW